MTCVISDHPAFVAMNPCSPVFFLLEMKTIHRGRPELSFRPSGAMLSAARSYALDAPEDSSANVLTINSLQGTCIDHRISNIGFDFGVTNRHTKDNGDVPVLPHPRFYV